MEKTLSWLSRNKLINVLLAIAFFLAVVTFHDEVTSLAIKLRKQLSVSGYNLFFSLATLLGFGPWMWWIATKVIKTREFKAVVYFLLPTLIFIVLFFFYMQTYAIEAVHFFQYAFLAALLYPLIRSYGATVFWTTLLGMVDEIHQYVLLTPDFDYFDFNDILLNLLGAGIAVVTIYIMTGYRTEKKVLSRSLAMVLLAISLIGAVYLVAYQTGLVTWYPTHTEGTPAWFSVNRTPPATSFWTKAYAGRHFHIINPPEGIALSLIFFSWYFLLDRPERKRIIS